MTYLKFLLTSLKNELFVKKALVLICLILTCILCNSLVTRFLQDSQKSTDSPRAVSSMEHVIITFASYKGHGNSYNHALNFTTQILSIPLLWQRFPNLKEVGFFITFSL